MANMRKYLSIDGLLAAIRKTFLKISKETIRNGSISLADCLMSGLAMFSLKYPSLLSFDNGKAEPRIKKNLSNLYGVEDVPSDTYLRERLDKVLPDKLRGAFKKIFAFLQRGKAL